MIVGTAFVFDMYLAKIPNYILIPGYFMTVPYAFFRHGISGVWQIFLCVGGALSVMYLLYKIRALGAGDAKLIALICGYIGSINALKYVILVLFLGALIGITKIIFNVCVEDNGYYGRTKIRFSLPIVLAYLVYLITVGGIK